ncbi:hypothetical protein BD779DRAFT_1732106 [Infundibulicybe gibba]|nr:hypothetical protein BD779DRAFT_1732106 [Infundibulicybe gibba]
MSGPYVLLQFGDDPFTANFEDLEGRAAFTMYASESPTLVMRLTREAVWSQHHPSVMGPDNSFFYFGPRASPGYIAYGNNRTSIPMVITSVKNETGARASRYFTAQSGKDYKWRITPQRMECIDGRTTLAVWELSQPEDDFHARLTIKHSGIALVTEILTTLILNRMSHALNW